MLPSTFMTSRSVHWWGRWMSRLERHFSDPARYEQVRANVFTRWMAQRRTRQLLGLMTGFVQTQVLVACVRFRILDVLSQDPQDLQSLASRLGLDPAALKCLLDSAVSIQLLRQDVDERYRIGALAHPVLGHAGIRAMVEHNQLLYRDLADPDEFLRNHSRGSKGEMAAYWPYAQKEGAGPALGPQAQAQSQRYSDLMDASQNFVIAEVLDSYNFSSHRCVLDIGCGKGRFAVALAQQLPHLNLQVLDLPHVMDLTRERLRNCGVLSRTQCFARSFLGEPLPRGADLVTLVRVAHDHSDSVLGQLLRQIWQALPVGGQLLLAEPMALAGGPASGSKEADPYFHFYMLAMGGGRLRSPDELTSLLNAAGFDGVRRLPTAMPIHAQVLLAIKSSVYPGMSDLKVKID